LSRIDIEYLYSIQAATSSVTSTATTTTTPSTPNKELLNMTKVTRRGRPIHPPNLESPSGILTHKGLFLMQSMFFKNCIFE